MTVESQEVTIRFTSGGGRPRIREAGGLPNAVGVVDWDCTCWIALAKKTAAYAALIVAPKSGCDDSIPVGICLSQVDAYPTLASIHNRWAGVTGIRSLARF